MEKVARGRRKRGDPNKRTRPPASKSGDIWIEKSDRKAIEGLVGVPLLTTSGEKSLGWKKRRELRNVQIPHVMRAIEVIARAVELARRIGDASPDDSTEWADLVSDIERVHAAAYGVQDAQVAARMRAMAYLEEGAADLRNAMMRRLLAREMKGERLSRAEQQRIKTLPDSTREKLVREIGLYGGAARFDSDDYQEKATTGVTEGTAHAIAKTMPHLAEAVERELQALRTAIIAYASPRNARAKEGFAETWLFAIGIGVSAGTLKTDMTRWRDRGLLQS